MKYPAFRHLWRQNRKPQPLDLCHAPFCDAKQRG
jgi:hypothetical protein